MTRADNSPASQVPLGLCLLGAGRMGSRHAENIARNPRAKLLYVVDDRRESAEQCARLFGATAATIEQALQDESVSGVVIATPTTTHADLIERSCRASKHVFCEKPVDLRVERVKDVLRVQQDTSATVVIGFNRRFDRSYRDVERAVAAGRVGRVELVSIISRDWPAPSLDYLNTSGGIFRDMTIHDFDMARWLMKEEPEEIYAQGVALIDPAIAAIGDIDSAALTMKAPSGALCTIVNSRRSVYGYDQRIEVFGSLGMVRAENQRVSSSEIFDASGGHTSRIHESFPERYENAYSAEIDHFIDCVLGHASPSVGIADGLRALVIAEAAEESLRTNRPVRIPPL